MTSCRLAIGVAICLACIAGPSASATGSTKNETMSAETSRDATFAAGNCSEASRRTLRLPRRAFAVEPVEPAVGDYLTDSTTGTEIARVEAIARGDHLLTWTVSPVSPGCASAVSAGAWETDAVTLAAAYKWHHRVLTHSTAIRRGDAICTQTGRRLDRLDRRLAHVTTIGQAARALDSLAAVVYAAVRRFDHLEIPRDSASSFRGWVDALEAMADEASGAADAVRDYRTGALKRAVRRIKRLARDGSRDARRYGFHVCGG